MVRTARIVWLLLLVSAAAGRAAAQDAPPQAPPTAAPPSSRIETPVTPFGHVEQHGEGPIPMVLIPGLVTDWTIYRGFMERNAARYTMFAVTLPGFGGTEAPPDPGAPFSAGGWLENSEAAVLKLVEDRHLERPVLVGQSMGGHIALRLATAHPERFRSAVIINSMAAYPLLGPGEAISTEDRRAAADRALAGQVEKFSQEQWLAEQAEWFAEAMHDQERAKAYAQAAAGVPKATSSRYMLEYFGADIGADLPRADLPMLVIAGIPSSAGDAAPILDMWRGFYRTAPRATVVFFHDTREFVTEDAPAELDRAIEQFLKGEPVQGKDRPVEVTPPAAPPAAPPAPAPEAPKP
jgi:pimeloyl-ACP methyl ester carboxylesterase